MRNIIAIIVLFFVATNGAFAHAMLDHADPKVGSTIASAPKTVTLWFTEQLEPAFSSIEVHNAQGATVSVGKATATGSRAQLQVPLNPLPPGTYKVLWRVMSVDTHRIQGEFTFTVRP